VAPVQSKNGQGKVRHQSPERGPLSPNWGLYLTGPPRDDLLFWRGSLLYVGSMAHVSGAAGKAANLGGCKSLYRQLPETDG
jgi:hypothetical protein